MNLQDFLKEVNGNENDIIEYSEAKALKAVKEDGNALQYVRNQTPEICLEAVKEDGNALQYVRNQTPEICLEAAKEDGDALKYVDKSIFKQTKTVEISIELYNKIKDEIK